MSNYAKVGQLLIRPLLNTGTPAIDLARMFYARYADMDFEADFSDYCRNGYVIVRPNLFGMVKPHRLANGDDAWHIQLVIGNLTELVMTLPCKLKWLTWCRNNQPDKMRVVRTDALFRRAFALAKRQQKEANHAIGEA